MDGADANYHAVVTEPLMHRSVSVFVNQGKGDHSDNLYFSFESNVDGVRKRAQNKVSMDSPLCEPLCYPLLFPYGERGWGKHLTELLSFQNYTVSRILMPEMTNLEQGHNGDGIMRVMNANGTRHIATNRFQLLARLKSYYLVEQYSRWIDQRLDWVGTNQSIIMGGTKRMVPKRKLSQISTSAASSSAASSSAASSAEASSSSIEARTYSDRFDREESEKTFLPKSVQGSPRHLRELARNALTIISELGHPTVFITVTCNTQWNEIQDRLFPGQTAFDREDIVCIVFKARLTALLHNLRHGHYFGGRGRIFEAMAIEYQHRGLPHAHIVFKLSNTPDKSDADACKEWATEYIHTRMPSAVDEPEYHALVTTHMVHHCSTKSNGCKKERGSVCKR